MQIEDRLDEFESLARQVDDALSAVQKLDQIAQEAAMKLKESLEAFERYALIRLVRRMRDDPAGKNILLDAVSDPAIYALFMVHGIVKSDIRTRVFQALEQVRPYINSHGGDVELIRVENHTVVVKLHGSCSGCGMSSQTLHNLVEKTIQEHVPEIDAIEVEDEELSGGQGVFIPLSAINLREDWIQALEYSEMVNGVPYRIHRDDIDAVIVRFNEQVVAYVNRCAHMQMPVDKGLVEGHILTCPWHGYQYDLKTGECRTVPGLRLDPVPVRLEGGSVWVRPRS